MASRCIRGAYLRQRENRRLHARPTRRCGCVTVGEKATQTPVRRVSYACKPTTRAATSDCPLRAAERSLQGFLADAPHGISDVAIERTFYEDARKMLLLRRCQRGKNFLAVALELRRADARDGRQLRERAGPALGDLLERRVVEDHVGRYLVGLRSLEPPLLQRPEGGR